jgi:ribosome biogenesis GTPase / thiamine phosphate phosphatase
LEKALILKSTGSWYSIKTEEGIVLNGKIKGKLRTLDIKSTNPVAVGDWVEIEHVDQETCVIVNILPRKNYIIRKSSNLSKESHILAANIDQALLIVTIAFPETSLEFIDRFLVAAEAYSIPVTIIINKIDLYKDTLKRSIQEIHQIYEPIGYKVVETSASEGIHLDELKSLLDHKTTLLSGNSGVGKSTLINSLYQDLDLKVGKISDYHLKGKHTTTFAEMFPLHDGAYIIDTPGIKGFGMVHMDKEEIYHFFPEIFQQAASCQYHNCLHMEEPNCAVKTAVEKGEISPSRYLSYMSILEDQGEAKYR